MLIIGISFAVLVIYLIGYWILTNANDNNEKKKEIVVGAWEEVIIGEEEAPKEEKPNEVPSDKEAPNEAPKEGKPILEVIKYYTQIIAQKDIKIEGLIYKLLNKNKNIQKDEKGLWKSGYTLEELESANKSNINLVDKMDL